MPELIGFDIYRTENLAIDEIPYTVRFAVSKDGQEYVLFVSNEKNRKNKKYQISKETADGFKHQTGEDLEAEMKRIIENDIQSGII